MDNVLIDLMNLSIDNKYSISKDSYLYLYHARLIDKDKKITQAGIKLLNNYKNNTHKIK